MLRSLSHRVFAVCCASVGVLTLAVSGAWGQTITVQSPNSSVVSTIKISSSRLTYNLTRGGTSVLEDSSMGVTINGVDLGLGVTFGTPTVQTINETYAVLGGHSTAVNNCNQYTIPVTQTASGKQYNLVVRAYNDGLAYRYDVPYASGTTQTITGEATSFKLPANTFTWYQTDVHAFEEQYDVHANTPITSVKTPDVSDAVAAPMVAKLPNNGGYVCITEGALTNYSGMFLKSTGNRVMNLNFRHWQNDTVRNQFSVAGNVVTPWRIAMTAADLNGMVNSDIVRNVNPAPTGDFSYVQPGRSVWSWWAHDRPDGWLADTDYSQEIRYIDQAKQLGFEYTVIDGGWPTFTQAHLDSILQHASDQGIKVWLWKDWSELDTAAERSTFYNWCNQKGVVGVKVDFMNRSSKDLVDFYSAARSEAAAHQLMIDFHGAFEPTGEDRTYPNELTREGVHGLEHSATVPPHIGFTPSSVKSDVILPFTRMLVGSTDYTPVTFTPSAMNNTSWSHQLGTAVVFTSPLQNWAEDPAIILANPALSIIKTMPSVWDQTKVLGDGTYNIGDMAAFARRTGEDWYVGILNNATGRTFNFTANFLANGHYFVQEFADNAGRIDAYTQRESVVKAGAAFSAVMRGSGGYVSKFTLLIDGDANHDGTVDVGDLGILGANYGAVSGKNWLSGDFNDDGAVDVGDLGMLGAHYGQVDSGTVPEPATLCLLAAGALGLVRRRR